MYGREPLRASVWVGRVRQGAPAGKYLGWSCTAGSPCGQVFGLVVYGYSRFYRRGFLGREHLRASGLARVRSVPFLMQGISRLTLEMTIVYATC